MPSAVAYSFLPSSDEDELVKELVLLSGAALSFLGSDVDRFRTSR